jgi:hypothetical protein
MFAEVWMGSVKGKDHLDDLGLDGRIISVLMLKKGDVRM